MFNVLDGYKTYIVAAIVVAIGLAEGLFGLDIPGIDVGANWMDYVLSGLGLGSVRSALGKIVAR
jgi:hypothetical protein